MIPRVALLTLDNMHAMVMAALDAFPGEACGVVLGDRSFHRMGARDARASVRASYGPEFYRLMAAKDVLAVFHSHPHMDPASVNAPSKRDMRFQMSTGVPHIIVATDGVRTLPPTLWGDTVEPEPVLTRGWQYGVSDELTCIRDWLRQGGRPYPDNPPRAFPEAFPEGWLRSYRYRDGSAQVGDVCVIFGLASPVAGVYVGAGRILTHTSVPLPYAPDHRATFQNLQDWLDRGARVFKHEKAGPPVRPSG